MMNRFAFLARVLLTVAVIASAEVAAQTSGSAHAYNTEGVALYEARNFAEAVTTFELAYELDPGSETIAANLCNAYMAYANQLAEAKNFEAAANILESAIQTCPKNPRPYVQLGAYYLRLNYVSDAIFRLEEAYDLAPEDVDLHDLLGEAYYRDNDLVNAHAQWKWVRQEDPEREGLAEKLAKVERELAVEQEYRRSGSQNFIINYESGTEGYKVRNILDVLERAYGEIGRALGNQYPPTPIQVIVYSAEKFAQVTLMGGHVGGLFDGKIRVPVTTTDGQALPQDELERRLYHEYVHVVVRHMLDDNTPWWINEGLAEALSRDVTANHRKLLQAARQGDQLFDLAKLEDQQLEQLEGESLNLAYRQAHFAVDYLLNRFGKRSMHNFLASLGQGANVETALRKHYYRSYATLQREISHQLR